MSEKETAKKTRDCSECANHEGGICVLLGFRPSKDDTPCEKFREKGYAI